MILSSRSNAERICSERELTAYTKEIADEIRERGGKNGYPRFLLRGPMGAGKSTFARAFLEAFGVDRAAEGSPTFAIAHEYESLDGVRILHADGYRLRGDEELEQTGLLETLWDPSTLVLFEWMELFPQTEAALRASTLDVREVVLGFILPEELAKGDSRDSSTLRRFRG